jgi:hypothetical protein
MILAYYARGYGNMHIHDEIRNHLLKDIDFSPVGDKRQTLDELLLAQWCEEFIHERKSRMIVGFFRYGDVAATAGRFDNVGSSIRRLRRYKAPDGGNGENLVDCANLSMIEFKQRNHPNYHFVAVDDGEHTKELT